MNAPSAPKKTHNELLPKNKSKQTKTQNFIGWSKISNEYLGTKIFEKMQFSDTNFQYLTEHQ